MTGEQELIRENLTESQREIADVIGLDNYIKLVKFINGDSIYIPKFSELVRPLTDKEIQEKFDGYNFRELAQEYGVAVKTIYNKVPKQLRVVKRSRPIDDQIKMENY